MSARTKSGGAVLVAGALLWLLTGGCGGGGTDLDAIVMEAKAKRERFEEDIADLTMTAQLVQEAPQGTMSLDMKVFTKGRKVRTEMVIPQMPGMPQGMAGAEIITIYDGTDTWMIHPMMGKTKSPGSESQNPFTQERDWWKSVSDKTVLSGKESVGGRDCHVIDFGEDDEVPLDKIWLDTEELLMIQAEVSAPNAITARILMSDFRPLEGEWKMPYKTEVFEGEKIGATITVTSVDVNTGLSDDLFDADKIEAEEVDFQQMMKQMQQGR